MPRPSASEKTQFITITIRKKKKVYDFSGESKQPWQVNEDT